MTRALRHLLAIGVLGVLGVLGVVTACATPAPAPEVDGPTVTVPGATGQVTVPVTDTGIWALDESTAVHLLAIGVRVTHAERTDYVPDEGLTALRSLVETAEIPLVEPGRSELVAAAGPALVMGSSSLAVDRVPELSRIAPVVLLDDNVAWDEQLRVLGDITGHPDHAAEVTARVRDAVTDTANRVAASPRAGAEVSVISACGQGQYCSYGDVRAMGGLLRSLGFARPPAQDGPGNEWGYTVVSGERIGEHRAEIVLALVGAVSGGAPFPLLDPLLDTTGSVTAEVDFGAWYGSGPLHVLWILHDVRAVVLGEGRPATAADAPALWAQLTPPGSAAGETGVPPPP